MVAPLSKFYTVSTVLFHKYGGSNVAVTNCMSHFSMFFPTKATVKLANGNTGNAHVARSAQRGVIQTQTPLQLNQLMMIKWIISWNYSTHNMMTIFYMLTSRCFKNDRWLLLLQRFLQYILCCFIKAGDQML